jgi:hypothetical protein
MRRTWASPPGRRIRTWSSDSSGRSSGREKLIGTVQLYERHVFLCYKGPEA